VGLAAAMGHSDDMNDFSIATKYDRIWKTAKWDSTMYWIKSLTQRWQFHEDGSNSFQLFKELNSESAQL
jgi:hypothetical protein